MRILFGLVIYALSLGAPAAESVMPLESADVDVFDLKSLERGAGYFVDYCMGCHSLKHMRYSRMAKDLQLTEQQMEQLMTGGAKIQDSMLTAMDKVDAQNWFGMDPPDLSLVARARGADWLYSYLKGFYVDPTRQSGVNNVVFDQVAMPNVLWELQGLQKPVVKLMDGSEVIVRLESAQPGKLSAKAFDQAVTDIVNFLVYTAEPAQFQRLRLGKYVIFGLIVFAVILFKLKKEYWKDIH